jgi:hypothetical protein
MVSFSHLNQKEINMQGSYTDCHERFARKEHNTDKNKVKSSERNWRDKRRNRRISEDSKK